VPRLKSSLAPRKSKRNLRSDDSASDGFGFPARNYCYGPVSLVSHPGIQADMTLTRRSNCGQPEIGDYQAGEQLHGDHVTVIEPVWNQ
jgi:hypothetical protein